MLRCVKRKPSKGSEKNALAAEGSPASLRRRMVSGSTEELSTASNSLNRPSRWSMAKKSATLSGHSTTHTLNESRSSSKTKSSSVFNPTRWRTLSVSSLFSPHKRKKHDESATATSSGFVSPSGETDILQERSGSAISANKRPETIAIAQSHATAYDTEASTPTGMISDNERPISLSLQEDHLNKLTTAAMDDRDTSDNTPTEPVSGSKPFPVVIAEDRPDQTYEKRGLLRLVSSKFGSSLNRSTGPENQNKDTSADNSADATQSFLRAARTGNKHKLADLLDSRVDIDVANSNGLTALHLAAKEAHTEVVRELLKRGANVHVATKKGNTALHVASLAGHLEIVKLLIEFGADVNCQSQNGFTPLYMAAQENHVEVVNLLLNNSANPALSTEDGFSPLAVALQQGHERIVAVLLERDSRGKTRLPALHIAAKKNDIHSATLLLNNPEVNVDHASTSGFTPLHIAAHYGNSGIAKLLLQRGANVNYAAKNSITPLHIASKWGKNEVVEQLLKSGAEIDARTRDGLSPLHCAARSGHKDVVETLLKAGANVSLKTKNELTPLHMCAQGDHEKVARLLLRAGANPDAITVDYLTPLHVAAHCGSVNVALALLEAQCNVNARALNGFTALHIASKKSKKDVVELLVKHGALLEAATETGLTPLHVASFVGCTDAVEVLLQRGANVNQTTLRNETALHLVARNNQVETAKVLLKHGAQVDAKTRDNQTPLHVAVRAHYRPMVVLLLDAGADPNCSTKDSYTALHLATKEDSDEIVSALLKHGVDSGSKTKKGYTPLHLAAKYGNLAIAHTLLEHANADPNSIGHSGFAPVHVAAYYKQSPILQLLVDYGADINKTVKNGFTPLHLSAKRNNLDCVRFLLEQGANVDARSRNGYTPLHLAAQDGHFDIVQTLVEHYGAIPDAAAKDGLTPLHLAVQEDKVPVAECLLNAGASLHAATTDAHFIPLHSAAYRGQLNALRLLLSKTPESELPSIINARTRMGCTPLHLAAQQGHVQTVLKLLQSGADANARNRQGWTAAQLAYKQHYLNLFEVLQNVTTNVSDWSVPSLTGAGPDGQTDGDPKMVTGSVTFEKVEQVVDHIISDSEDETDELLPTPTLLRRRDRPRLPAGDQDSLRSRTASYDFICQQLEYMRTRLGEAEDTSIPGTPQIRMDSIATTRPRSLFIPSGTKTSGDEMVKSGIQDGRIDGLPKSLASDQEQMVIATKTAGQMQTVQPSPAGLSLWDFDTDNMQLTRKPIRAGFLISFLVDARGCLVEAQRRADLRFFIPPNASPAPTRIICRVLRPEFAPNHPNMNDGECLAARILEMAPFQMQFTVPILIEVPHIASLRNREREIVILRSETGSSWKEHPLEATDSAVRDALGEAFDRIEPESTLRDRQIHRILTYDFPQYFALLSRFRQEVVLVGSEGGLISSTVAPQVQAVFPPGALQKRIKVALQAQPIAPELVRRLVGPRVSVSPVVSIEPRRRKFHKPITITVPLPRPPPKSEQGAASNVRLLCSLSGGTNPAVWEDITGVTPMTKQKDCVSFTTTVSARLWLINCPEQASAVDIGSRIYRESIVPPVIGRFAVFVRQPMNLDMNGENPSSAVAARQSPGQSRGLHRPSAELAQLRCLCLTDDQEDKTLECLERFALIAVGTPTEVLEDTVYWIELTGNLAPVTKADSQPSLLVRPFHENRVTFPVRVRDSGFAEPESNLITGKISFMRDPRHTKPPVDDVQLPQQPVTTLDLRLPRPGESILVATADSEIIGRSELNRAMIARQLGSDWQKLASVLGFSEEEVESIIRTPSSSPPSSQVSEQEKAEILLTMWQQKFATNGAPEEKPLGNQLADALIAINRSDVIHPSMIAIRPVVSPDEQARATAVLDKKKLLPKLVEEPPKHPPTVETVPQVTPESTVFAEPMDESTISTDKGISSISASVPSMSPIKTEALLSMELLPSQPIVQPSEQPSYENVAGVPAVPLTYDEQPQEIEITRLPEVILQPRVDEDKTPRVVTEMATAATEFTVPPVPVIESEIPIAEASIQPIEPSQPTISASLVPEAPLIQPQAILTAETRPPQIFAAEVEAADSERVPKHDEAPPTKVPTVETKQIEQVTLEREEKLELPKIPAEKPPEGLPVTEEPVVEEIVTETRRIAVDEVRPLPSDTTTLVVAAQELAQSIAEEEVQPAGVTEPTPGVHEESIEPAVVERYPIQLPVAVEPFPDASLAGLTKPEAEAEPCEEHVVTHVPVEHEFVAIAAEVTEPQQPDLFEREHELPAVGTDALSDEEFEKVYLEARQYEYQPKIPIELEHTTTAIQTQTFPSGPAGHDVTQSSPEESHSFEEVEEVLPDGTVVKSRTAITETTQSVSCHDWQEGVDAALESGRFEVQEPEEKIEVEEIEEVQPDGSVITRIITTKHIVDRVVEHAVSDELIADASPTEEDVSFPGKGDREKTSFEVDGSTGGTWHPQKL
ncbi:ankyrin [Clonorchis sinensis]|uniref:Ankyrin n=1 Tax=Clonorchis sinensis TaxID=79923 RepID=G7Y2F9_CLOSI|nr:ankyrin [Clonorchis sinensis]